MKQESNFEHLGMSKLIYSTKVGSQWSFIRQESATRWTYCLVLGPDQKYFIELDLLRRTWRRSYSNKPAKPWLLRENCFDFGLVLLSLEEQLARYPSPSTQI